MSGVSGDSGAYGAVASGAVKGLLCKVGSEVSAWLDGSEPSVLVNDFGSYST